ncbi:hypothetical protein LSAT2_018731 [Lamellibrachia satsuma]|nr:hypothetical protein LSAT2_018731 [Lamellibrachia satsuma]
MAEKRHKKAHVAEQTPRQWRHSAYHHCYNLIINSKQTVRSDCNGGKRYNTDTHTCCNDKLYPKQVYKECCDGEFYDTRAGSCILGVALINNVIGCDGTYYNKNHELCCNKKIYAKLPNRRCCLHVALYDPTIYECTFFGNLEKKRKQ